MYQCLIIRCRHRHRVHRHRNRTGRAAISRANPDIQPGRRRHRQGQKSSPAGMIAHHRHPDTTSFPFARSRSKRRSIPAVTTMIGGGRRRATFAARTPGSLAYPPLEAAEAFPMNLSFWAKVTPAAGSPAANRVNRPRLHRRLGHHAGGHRLLPCRGRRNGRPGRHPYRYLERSGFVRRTIAAFKGSHHPHLSIPKAPGAAMLRTSSRRQGLRTFCPVRPTPRCPTTVNTMTAPGHARGLPPRTGHRRGPSPSPNRASAARPPLPRTFSPRPGRLLDDELRLQAMGRVSEVILRTQVAHWKKVQRHLREQSAPRQRPA